MDLGIDPRICKKTTKRLNHCHQWCSYLLPKTVWHFQLIYKTFSAYFYKLSNISFMKITYNLYEKIVLFLFYFYYKKKTYIQMFINVNIYVIIFKISWLSKQDLIQRILLKKPKGRKLSVKQIFFFFQNSNLRPWIYYALFLLIKLRSRNIKKKKQNVTHVKRMLKFCRLIV